MKTYKFQHREEAQYSITGNTLNITVIADLIDEQADDLFIKGNNR